MPKGTAERPAVILETLVIVRRRSDEIWTLYQHVHATGYDQSGRNLDGSRNSSSTSTVEAAVTESAERARAQDAATRATNELREAEMRLAVAQSALERAMGGRRVIELERSERLARRQRKERGR
jgi:hypothetical protein